MATLLLWRDIIEISDKVCRKYGLSYGQILPSTSKRQYGLFGEATACDRCYNSKIFKEENCNEKIIKIRIHQYGRPNRPLKTSTILNTLAHELAHLKYWNHGEQHTEFTKEIIDYMESLGYDVLHGA